MFGFSVVEIKNWSFRSHFPNFYPGSEPMVKASHSDCVAAVARASMVVGELTIATTKAALGVREVKLTFSVGFG